MNYKENQHYVNEHGQQLKQFMIEKFGIESYRNWCALTAFKYEARAGKKEGNSIEKDLKKRDDYLNELKGSDFNYFDEGFVKRLAKDFESYKG